MASLPTSRSALAASADTPRSGAWQRFSAHPVCQALRKLRRNRLTLAGLAVVAGLIVVALFAPWIAPYDPGAQDLLRALQPPGAQHWFGTDEYGRDVFSRLVHGSRITLYIITLVAVVVGPIGLAIGVVAGYFGGWVETVFMRITDIFISFPSLVLALAFVAALGPGRSMRWSPSRSHRGRRSHGWRGPRRCPCAMRISSRPCVCKEPRPPAFCFAISLRCACRPSSCG